MKLRIPHRVADHWVTALTRARSREIGGILFGEHVGDADFRIVEATVQKRGGNDRTFHRRASKARRDLKKLSLRYGQNPEQFNYLGEWHSHPNALVSPSWNDELTMKELLDDPEVIVNFLILLINRLDDHGVLEVYACTYQASGQKIPCEIIAEPCETTL